MIRALIRRVRAARTRISRVAVRRLGAAPAWFGYRFYERESVPEYLARCGLANSLEVIHPGRVHQASLPLNIADANALPDDRGWWGFSFRDVPARENRPTFRATLRDCTLAHYRESPDHPFSGDYYVGILNSDQRSLELREIRFRPKHAQILRSRPRVERIDRATWVIERVYHNYSHWLTAHLPKLVLLRDRGELADVMLPPGLSGAHQDSLLMLGLDPADFRTFDPAAVQRVEQLTILGTDRFRPELLRRVREAFIGKDPPPPHRRIFISRARAARRRLLNEEEVWPVLEKAGFEKVFMEDLSFERQIELMSETAVLFAPHGAGLTNMIFCPENTHVIEIADLGFPNPNFYALASAMGHRYWLLSAVGTGDAHPLEKDMVISESAVRTVLTSLG